MQSPNEPPSTATDARTLGAELALIGLVGVLVAAVAGATGALLNPVGDYGVETDFFAVVVAEVERWQAGEIPVGRFRGPLHGFLVALTEPVWGDAFVAAKAISAVAAGAFVAAVGSLLLRPGRFGVGLAAALVAASSPVVMRNSTLAATDLLFAALFTGALALLVGPLTGRPTLRAGLAGVLVSAAALTRYNGLALLPVLALVAAMAPRAGASARDRLRPAAAVLLAELVVMVPWGLHTRAVMGRWFANDNHLNLAYDLYGRRVGDWDTFWYGDERPQFSGFGEVIAADPAAFVAHIVRGVPDHLCHDALHLAGVPLALLGVVALWGTRRHRPDRREAGLLLAAAAMFGVLLLVFPDPRFSLTLLPAWVALAVRPLWAARDPRWPRVAPFALAVVVAVQAGTGIAAESARRAGQPVDMLELVDRFEAEVPADLHGARIAARKPHVAYHLGLDFVTPPPVDRFRDFAVWLTENDVDLLYISGIEAMMWPRLAPLQRAEQVPAVVTPLIVIESPPAVLYRVNHTLIREAARGQGTTGQ